MSQSVPNSPLSTENNGNNNDNLSGNNANTGPRVWSDLSMPISFFVPFGAFLTTNQFNPLRPLQSGQQPNQQWFSEAMMNQFGRVDMTSNDNSIDSSDLSDSSNLPESNSSNESPPLGHSQATTVEDDDVERIPSRMASNTENNVNSVNSESGHEHHTPVNNNDDSSTQRHASNSDSPISPSLPGMNTNDSNFETSTSPSPNPLSNNNDNNSNNPSSQTDSQQQPPYANSFSIFPIIPTPGSPLLVAPDGTLLQQWIVFPPGVNPLNPPQNSPYYIFHTPMHPAFMPTPQPPKPKASKKQLEELPILPLSSILPGESCPVCYEDFIPTRASPTAAGVETDDGSRPLKKKAIATKLENTHADIIVRRMQPCGHLFCQKCLFEWLERDIRCPMCRAELTHDNNESDSLKTMNGDVNRRTNRSPSQSPRSPSTSCDIHPSSLCNHAGEDLIVNDDPILTLDSCHHRFHRSCVITVARVQGYDISEEVDFRCPRCRIVSKLNVGMEGQVSGGLSVPTLPVLPVDIDDD